MNLKRLYFAVTHCVLHSPSIALLFSRSTLTRNYFSRHQFKFFYLQSQEKDDLESLTIPDLKEKLRYAGLPVGGKKSELVERLLKSPELPILKAKSSLPDNKDALTEDDQTEELEMQVKSLPTTAKLSYSKEGSLRPPILYFIQDQCSLDEEEIYDMVATRSDLRSQQEYKAADSMKEELEENGILIMDLPKENTYQLMFCPPQITPEMLRLRLRAAGLKPVGRKENLYKLLMDNKLEADWDAPSSTCYVPVHLQGQNEDVTTAMIDFDRNLASRVIGRKGQVIRSIEEETGCQLNIDQNPPDLEEEEEELARVVITGSPDAVASALQMTKGHIEQAKASLKRAEKEKERKTARLAKKGPRGDADSSESQDSQKEAGSRVFVHNLPFDCTWQDLKDYFAKAGEVEFVRISTDREGNQRGHGVVDFVTKQDADNAIETLNDSQFNGRRIGVRADMDADRRQERGERTERQFNRDSEGRPGRSGRGDGREGRFGRAEGREGRFGRREGKEDWYGRGSEDNEARFERRSKNMGGSPGRATESERKPLRVYVDNLPYEATWADLKDHFKENFQQGEVTYTKINEDRDGNPIGSGIVQFATKEQREDAILAMDQTDFMGRTIHVREDIDRFSQDGYQNRYSNDDKRSPSSFRGRGSTEQRGSRTDRGRGGGRFGPRERGERFQKRGGERRFSTEGRQSSRNFPSTDFEVISKGDVDAADDAMYY